MQPSFRILSHPESCTTFSFHLLFLSSPFTPSPPMMMRDAAAAFPSGASYHPDPSRFHSLGSGCFSCQSLVSAECEQSFVLFTTLPTCFTPSQQACHQRRLSATGLSAVSTRALARGFILLKTLLHASDLSLFLRFVWVHARSLWALRRQPALRLTLRLLLF